MNRDQGRRLAMSIAAKYGLDPAIFGSQIQQESGYRGDAVSPVGARGPAQIMPATWKDPGFGLSFEGDINNYEDNLEAGAQYQRAMLDRYGGDQVKALASYNWGAGNVDDWNGDPNKLPEETRGYVDNILSMAGQQGNVQPQSDEVMSLAQEAASPEQGNSPVTPEEEARMTFHPGMALSSLGAALAASAEGKSASDDLDVVRGQYFRERQAEEERQQVERARQAAIQMVGADTTYGKALAGGADPQLVMQQYAQDRGFQHDARMQEAGFGHAEGMQTRGFGHDYSMETLRDKNADERTAQEYEWRTGEREAGQEFDAGQRDLDRSQRREETELSAEQWRKTFEQDVQEFTTGQTNIAASGMAAQDLIAEQYEAAGMSQQADRVRAMPPQSFADPQMVRQYLDVVTSTAEKSDLDTGLAEASKYLELQQTDPAKAKALWEALGNDSSTSTTSANLSTDYQMVTGPDGVQRAQVIEGSKTDLENKKAASQAASAADSANTDTGQKAVNVLRSLNNAEEATGPFSTGLIGQVLGGVGGTNAYEVRAELKTAVANIAFDRLQAMREASPTGGALGSVTEGELALLSSTIAALDPNMGGPAFKENLQHVRSQYQNILRKVVGADASPEEKAEVYRSLGTDAATVEALLGNNSQEPDADGFNRSSDGRRWRVK